MSANRLMLISVALLALGGVGVSAYLTSVHYASTPLVCSSNGVIDCHRVLTSSYSEVLGLPWSVGGMVWFGVSGALALIALSRRTEAPWLQPVQLAWSLQGMCVVLYLIGVEAVAVKSICLWCTAMHALIFATFLLILLRTPAMAEAASEPQGAPRANSLSGF
jgi:uncharacterized membrane protein